MASDGEQRALCHGGLACDSQCKPVNFGDFVAAD
jgi:hypothetical protein